MLNVKESGMAYVEHTSSDFLTTLLKIHDAGKEKPVFVKSDWYF